MRSRGRGSRKAPTIHDVAAAAGVSKSTVSNVVRGADDIAVAGLHRISLTTIAQRLDFQAERAVSLLLERIHDPGLPPRHTSVPVELRVRHSAARVRDRRGHAPA